MVYNKLKLHYLQCQSPAAFDMTQYPPHIVMRSLNVYSRKLVFCKKSENLQFYNRNLQLYNCKANLTVLRKIQFEKQIGLYRYKSKNSCAQLISILMIKFIQKVLFLISMAISLQSQ